MSVFLERVCNKTRSAESVAKEGAVELKQTIKIPAANDSNDAVFASRRSLRYYIHDHSAAFRIQLVGAFREIDLAELDGCWTTASKSVAERPVCIDLRGITAIDAGPRAWLSRMAAQPGVEFVVTPEMEPELPDGCAYTVQAITVERTGSWRALRAWIVRERRPGLPNEIAKTPAPVTIGSTENQAPAV
jgi:hypothetical protein